MSALAVVEDVVDAELVDLEPLTEVEARALTVRLRAALTITNELMVEAFRREAWRVLGYVSWRAYCRAELQELRGTKIPRKQRRAMVAELAEFMANREIAEAWGIDESTIRADRAALRVVGEDERVPAVLEVAPAPPALPPAPVVVERRPCRRQDVAAWVASRGHHGATWLEVAAEFGWHHGQVSGALSGLHAAGGLARLVERRDRCSVYVAVAEVSGRPTVVPGAPRRLR